MLKWKKWSHSLADNISLYFPSIKILRIFLPKGGRSSAFISENVGRSGLTVSVNENYTGRREVAGLGDLPLGCHIALPHATRVLLHNLTEQQT